MKLYTRWTYLALLLMGLAGVLYALPNVFGDDYAVQITASKDKIATLETQSREALQKAKLPILASEKTADQLVLRVADGETQLKAATVLRQLWQNEAADSQPKVGLTLLSKSPLWLQSITTKTMSLGLDLRGGVHLLLQVDMPAAMKAAQDRLARDIPAFLRNKNLRYASVTAENNQFVIGFNDANIQTQAAKLLGEQYPELNIDIQTPKLILNIKPEEIARVTESALKQNLTTIRNRIDGLGVAEPIVQQQGKDRIVVQLPGVQDTSRAKEILGAQATLEFRAVNETEDVMTAASSGVAPYGTELYEVRKDGDRPSYPILLADEPIAVGEQLVDAAATIDTQNNRPAVSVTLDGRGADAMLEHTTKNIGKRMAVLYIETKTDVTIVDGKEVRSRRIVKEVISDANIQGAFGRNFQITGLKQSEASNLALMLRSGALAAPMDVIEERTIGPSLGKDNIQRGWTSVGVGFALVILFMVGYYKLFGLFANIAVMFNLIFLIAIMSLMGATLTLPGLAGMVLTLGMAVDANVLIYERIREELRHGANARAAIEAGYDRAFWSIADANITTLIAALFLYAFGTGPIKGFAVTLTIGLLTSMFTAIVGTRALANLVYGNAQRGSKLAV